MILVKLLSHTDSFTNELLSRIIREYVTDCESSKNYEWRYYCIKYALFRPGSHGKFCEEDFGKRPYEFSVMKTEYQVSENTNQPFLKVVYDDKVSKDHYGERAILGDHYVVCENSAYVVKNTYTDLEVERITIAQNDKGIDIEDRIKKLQSVTTL